MNELNTYLFRVALFYIFPDASPLSLPIEHVPLDILLAHPTYLFCSAQINHCIPPIEHLPSVYFLLSIESFFVFVFFWSAQTQTQTSKLNKDYKFENILIYELKFCVFDMIHGKKNMKNVWCAWKCSLHLFKLKSIMQQREKGNEINLLHIIKCKWW